MIHSVPVLKSFNQTLYSVSRSQGCVLLYSNNSLAANMVLVCSPYVVCSPFPPSVGLFKGVYSF